MVDIENTTPGQLRAALINCLDDTVRAQVLRHCTPDASYLQIKQQIKFIYGTRDLTNAIRLQLKTIRRNRGEDLFTYRMRLEAKADLVWPNWRKSNLEPEIADYYINGLGNVTAMAFVRSQMREFTLNEAYQASSAVMEALRLHPEGLKPQVNMISGTNSADSSNSDNSRAPNNPADNNNYNSNYRGYDNTRFRPGSGGGNNYRNHMHDTRNYRNFTHNNPRNADNRYGSSSNFRRPPFSAGMRRPYPDFNRSDVKSEDKTDFSKIPRPDTSQPTPILAPSTKMALTNSPDSGNGRPSR